MVNGGPIKFEIDVLIKSEIIMRINVILSDISSASAVGGSLLHVHDVTQWYRI